MLLIQEGPFKVYEFQSQKLILERNKKMFELVLWGEGVWSAFYTDKDMFYAQNFHFQPLKERLVVHQSCDRLGAVLTAINCIPFALRSLPWSWQRNTS